MTTVTISTEPPLTSSTASGGRVLAIDPGSAASGWVLMAADGRVLAHGKDANEDLLALYRDELVNDEETFDRGDIVVMEYMAPRGMLTSEHEFDALWMAGRLTEALRPIPVIRVSRQEVKYVLLHSYNVKNADAVVRQVLIDRYAAAKRRQVGGSVSNSQEKAARRLDSSAARRSNSGGSPAVNLPGSATNAVTASVSARK